MFFFFISEVGIRDYKVTVFQTCALPISLARLRDDSDLIDKGEDLGFRFAGTAPDLGAFELGLEPEPEPMEDRKRVVEGKSEVEGERYSLNVQMSVWIPRTQVVHDALIYR